MHINSIEAFCSERHALSKRAADILEWLRTNGPATDRAVMEGMGFREPNAVRPRITELVQDKKVEEVGSIQCPVTRKSVRVVRVK